MCRKVLDHLSQKIFSGLVSETFHPNPLCNGIEYTEDNYLTLLRVKFQYATWRLSTFASSLSIPALSSPADAEWRKGGGSQSQSTHNETHLPPIKQRRRMMGNGKDAACKLLPVGICPRRNVVFAASVGYETHSGVGAVRLITRVEMAQSWTVL